MPTAERLLRAGRKLSKAVAEIPFEDPVAFVYNPLDYAWKPYSRYIKLYADATKRVVFLGMNPGPWGMAQTGVPFGQIETVRNWLDIDEPVGKPPAEHPKRPVQGFDCPRSEVSGERLWGLFRERFGSPRVFFKDHFVSNYCPLVFMEESSRNLTPDKLRLEERKRLFALCNDHLRATIRILEPEWVIGVGAFARKRIEEVLDDVKIGVILHPSPASPAANRGWAEAASIQLRELGVWQAGS